MKTRSCMHETRTPVGLFCTNVGLGPICAGLDAGPEPGAAARCAERRRMRAGLRGPRLGRTLWPARSLPQLVKTVRQLDERGFGFRSLTEGIDTTTASGTLVFHVFGALAQFERDLIRERTMASLAAAEQADAGGAPPGRGDAERQEGLSLHQRRDPQPLDRPHRVLPSFSEGADPGAQRLTAGKGVACVSPFTVPASFLAAN